MTVGILTLASDLIRCGLLACCVRSLCTTVVTMQRCCLRARSVVKIDAVHPLTCWKNRLKLARQKVGSLKY